MARTMDDMKRARVPVVRSEVLAREESPPEAPIKKKVQRKTRPLYLHVSPSLWQRLDDATAKYNLDKSAIVSIALHRFLSLDRDHAGQAAEEWARSRQHEQNDE